jgi:EpsI family protein
MNKRILIISVIILLFALYMNIFPFHEIVPLKKAFADFPINLNGWVGKVYYFDSTILDKLRVKEYMLREYKKSSDGFTLYVGYYGAQKEGAQIHSPKHCLPGGGWLKLSERKRSLDIDGVGKVNFVEATYQKSKNRELFIYWYKMKNVYITNEYVLKFYMILNSLRYRRNDAAFVRFSAPVTKDLKDTTYLVENAMRDFLPLLKEYLPE